MALVRETHSNPFVPQGRNLPQATRIRYWQTEAVQRAENLNSDKWTFSWDIPSHGKICSEHDYFCGFLMWATFCSRIMGAEGYIPRQDATNGGSAPARDSLLATTLSNPLALFGSFASPGHALSGLDP